MENRLSETWDAIGPLLGVTIRIFVVGPLLGYAAIVSVWATFTILDQYRHEPVPMVADVRVADTDAHRSGDRSTAEPQPTTNPDLLAEKKTAWIAKLLEAFSSIYGLLVIVSASLLLWRT